MKKILGFFFIGIGSFIAGAVNAQSLLDSCFTTATPSPTFTGSAVLVNSYDADLMEWTGSSWNGAWSHANITTPPPCNTPPVRALWVGDSSVWTTGGEAFGLKFSPPLSPGTTCHFTFTYVSAGLGSNGAFGPSVYTNANGLPTGNYVGDLQPAGTAWETHTISFTATPAQAGDEFLIIHSYNGSGMVLNLCAETFADLNPDSMILCYGDTAVLDAGQAQSYLWSTGETTSTISVTTTGNYSVTTQGSCGTSSDTIVITLDPCGQFPVAIFSAPDNDICPGTCTDFTNLSQSANSYIWNFQGANPSTSTDTDPVNICYNTPGTYAVQLIASNGLLSDTLTLNNFVTVYPYPAPQGIMQSGDTLFANPGAYSYQWYYNTTAIPGATDYYYIAPVSGNYNVIATDANGCEVEAVIVDVIADVDETLPGNEVIGLFPNPASQKLLVKCADNIRLVFISNALGELVEGMNIAYPAGNELQIDLQSFSPGVYMIGLHSGEKILRTKFLKE